MLGPFVLGLRLLDSYDLSGLLMKALIDGPVATFSNLLKNLVFIEKLIGDAGCHS